MENAKKAALLSALFFPGWGQIYLKHYFRGMIFVISVLAGALSLAVAIIFSGRDIIRATPLQKGTVQFSDIIAVSIKSVAALDLQFLLSMTMLILLLWILSIVDAYRLGKKSSATATIDVDQEATSDRP